VRLPQSMPKLRTRCLMAARALAAQPDVRSARSLASRYPAGPAGRWPKAIDISPGSVQRIWRARKPQLDRLRTFKCSRDPSLSPSSPTTSGSEPALAPTAGIERSGIPFGRYAGRWHGPLSSAYLSLATIRGHQTRFGKLRGRGACAGFHPALRHPSRP
jgi:hypothetical protein